MHLNSMSNMKATYRNFLQTQTERRITIHLFLDFHNIAKKTKFLLAIKEKIYDSIAFLEVC